MTKRRRIFAAAAAVVAAAAVSASATSAMAGGDDSDKGSTVLREQLSGYEETPLAISTSGSGRFFALVNSNDQKITYRLSYTLEFPVTQAHIHFGATAQSGGISAFICSNLGNGPAGTQACPPAPATVSGTIEPDDIVGPAGQGIAAGEFDELVAAIRNGTAYVNVHSTQYPGGEIRAQFPHQH
jgi:hypothetical protein